VRELTLALLTLLTSCHARPDWQLPVESAYAEDEHSPVPERIEAIDRGFTECERLWRTR